MTIQEDLRRKIAVHQDFPVPGVAFIDYGAALVDPSLYADIIREMTRPFRDSAVDAVMGAEARGLYFASPIATELSAGFVPARKQGKLPGHLWVSTGEIFDANGVAPGDVKSSQGKYATYRKDYTFEISKRDIKPRSRVLIVDDILAKGGTAQACAKLVAQADALVAGYVFLIEIASLGGRANLADPNIHRVLSI